MSENQGTKLCKHCKSEMPKGAKVCPNCRKKQGGIVKWVVIAVVVLVIIGAAMGGGNNKDDGGSGNNVASEGKTESGKKTEKTEEKKVEYISVSANKLSDALENNAMKAQNDYKDKYLEITGKLGNIDSSGDYIDLDSNKDFDMTIIQCYIKSDEQKEVIMKMKKGDKIKVKGHCTDVGELMGYSIDIESVEP